MVEEVATTDDYVFVPNSSSTSTTVARIDAEDLDVSPLEVGGRPVTVRAADIEGTGAVAYVLTEQSSHVAIIRADGTASTPEDEADVSFVSVPEEVNTLTLSPDGRHLLAYIDPDKPLSDETSAASLQVMSAIRLGDSPSGDRSFRLSVTRLVREIEFAEEGSEAYVIGREGINRIQLDALEDDTFIPPLDLDLDATAFPPQDREVEVSLDGSVLVVRNSNHAGLALYRPPASPDESGLVRTLDLPSPPTDIDLVSIDGRLSVVAALRPERQITLIDVETVFGAANPGKGVRMVEVRDTSPGLTLATPNRRQLLTYSTLETWPRLGVLDLESSDLRTYRLRNQIRGVTLTSDGSSAVIVHAKQSGSAPPDATPAETFRYRHGLTLFELETGYRRPITLRARPEAIVLTQNDEGTSLLYAILPSDDPRSQGLVRIDLSTYRQDFTRLPREPSQIGRVADQIYINQASEQGRITFVDVNTGASQTISGYELNALVD